MAGVAVGGAAAATCCALNAGSCACATCATCMHCCTPSTCSSMASRLTYMAFVALAAAVAIFLRYWGSEAHFDIYSFTVGCEADRCYGIQAVYRISFALLVFFLILALLTACVRAAHVGWWFFKTVALAGLCVIMFFVPNDFFSGYAEVARVGSLLFLLLQVLAIIDFAFNVHEFFLHRLAAFNEDYKRRGYEEPTTCQNPWAIGYIVAVVLLILTSLVGLIVMWSILPGCPLNNFFLSETLLFGIVSLLVSMTEKVGQGALPPVVIWAYNVWLAWGAITNNPDTECNSFTDEDDLGRIIVGLIVAVLSLAWTSLRTANSAYDVLKPGTTQTLAVEPTDQTAEPLSGAAPSPATSYSSMGKSQTNPVGAGATPAGAVGGGAATAVAARPNYANEDEESHGSAPNEVGGVAHAPVEGAVWTFHLTMCLAGMYLAMLLTNWGSAEGSGEPSSNPEASKTSMWVRIASQFAINLLYGWILVAGFCFPNREFGTRRA